MLALVFYSVPSGFCDMYFDTVGAITHFLMFFVSCFSTFFVGSHTISDVGSFAPRQIIMTIFAIMWAIRLGAFLFGRILIHRTDGRMTPFKNNIVTWANVWMFQAFWVYMVDMPVVLVNMLPAQSHPSFGTIFDIIGVILWVAGFLFETIADAQKSAFRHNPDNKDKFITHGVWGMSQHPNHFGEVCMWVGMSFLATSASSGTMHVHWMSPLMTLMIVNHSGMGMLDRRAIKKWGTDEKFLHYKANVPWFIPTLSFYAPPSKAE